MALLATVVFATTIKLSAPAVIIPSVTALVVAIVGVRRLVRVDEPTADAKARDISQNTILRAMEAMEKRSRSAEDSAEAARAAAASADDRARSASDEAAKAKTEGQNASLALAEAKTAWAEERHDLVNRALAREGRIQQLEDTVLAQGVRIDEQAAEILKLQTRVGQARRSGDQ